VRRIVIFVGPTLSADEIQAILPNAEIFPPVEAGDLLRLSLESGDIVAIIDGYYFQRASVRHKEILSLLKRGVHVWGAASMGALRAAELAELGMRGFGRVFEGYMRGEIEGDDEVAVLHAPKEMDYRSHTEALVNIKHVCRHAVLSDILPRDAEKQIVDIAKELPFFERTYRTILDMAVERGLSLADAEAVRNLAGQDQLDLKKSDALELIHALSTPPSGPAIGLHEWSETTFSRNWEIGAKEAVIDGNIFIPNIDILTYLQIFGYNYPKIHYQILLEVFVRIASKSLDTDSAPPILSVLEQFRQSGREIDFPSTMGKDTASDAFSLIAQYMSTNYGFSEEGGLPESVNRWLRPAERTLAQAEKLTRVAIRLWSVPHGYDWRGPMIDHIKTQEFFVPLVRAVYFSQRINEALLRRHDYLNMHYVSGKQVIEWFMQRWELSEHEFEFEIRDRGFRSTPYFAFHALPYYLLDRFVGAPVVKGM